MVRYRPPCGAHWPRAVRCCCVVGKCDLGKIMASVSGWPVTRPKCLDSTDTMTLIPYCDIRNQRKMRKGLFIAACLATPFISIQMLAQVRFGVVDSETVKSRLGLYGGNDREREA